MLTFLEGLPRSGKSYSAMKEAVIPALKDGRKVFTNIAGLDHGKIAPLAGISIPRCCELLIQLEDSQVTTVFQHVENDALVILDEIQDFFPTARQKLSPEMTEFITRHGHRGIDLIIMGQAVKDVHTLWRRRIERKNYFLKLTALGKPDRYSVTFFNAVLRGDEVVYEQIQSIEYDYDPAYFGTYRSHAPETKNKETLVESRGVVYNTPLFKKWIPIFGLAMVAAVGYMVWFFSGGFTASVQKKPEVAKAKIQDGPQPTADQLRAPPGYAPVVAGSGPVPTVAPLPGPPPALPVPLPAVPLDVIESLNKLGRIRFSGFVRVGNNTKGLVEWRDGAMNLMQQMTLADIAGLGYAVMVNQTGSYATFTKGSTTLVALSWPLDKAPQRLSDEENAKVAGTPRGMKLATAADVYKPSEPEHRPYTGY